MNESLFIICFLFLMFSGIIAIIGAIIIIVKSVCYTNKNPEFLSDKEHTAIILANNYSPENFSLYLDGVDLLIKYFKTNEMSYKVYKEVTGKDFKEIVKNQKVKSLYIFGHGCKHGIKFERSDFIYYCELQDAPKKDFIAQLHCNHGGGFSLADYLAKESYVIDGKRRWWQNRLYFREKLKMGPKTNSSKTSFS